MEKKHYKKHAHISDDKLTIEYDMVDFTESLPNLSDEIFATKNNSPISIIGVRQKNVPHDPEVTDFLQRCKTDGEARDIIYYLQNKGEISEEKAKELINQLEKKGVRSFGPLKSYGYYERNFRNK
ncbi:MAG: DUF2095 family protein [Promethearchaeota archaeon]